MADKNIDSCICCGKEVTKNNVIRRIMCMDCMANIIKNINIAPDEHYIEFIDFAYSIKERLIAGEDAIDIMDNAPDGFDLWLKKNASLSGFGIISD